MASPSNIENEGNRNGIKQKLLKLFVEYCLGPIFKNIPTWFKISDAQENELDKKTQLIIDGALSSASFASVLVILSSDQIGFEIYIATLFFSVAIPSVISGYLIRMMVDVFEKSKVIINASIYLTNLGRITAIIGIIFLVFHISSLAGVFFLVFMVLGILSFIITALIIIVNDDELLAKYEAKETMTEENYNSMLFARVLIPLMLDFLADLKRKETDTKN